MPVFEKRARNWPRPFDDVVIAAVDENIGDRRGELVALGDLAQMRLAFALGDLDQRLVGQAIGAGQHGPRDIDRVVGGELAHDLRRSVGTGREPFAQFGERVGFQASDQPVDDVVEQRHLLLGQFRRRREEKVGDLPHDIDTCLR